MTKGYLVAHIRVHDKEGFEKFKEMAGPVKQSMDESLQQIDRILLNKSRRVPTVDPKVIIFLGNADARIAKSLCWNFCGSLKGTF